MICKAQISDLLSSTTWNTVWSSDTKGLNFSKTKWKNILQRSTLSRCDNYYKAVTYILSYSNCTLSSSKYSLFLRDDICLCPHPLQDDLRIHFTGFNDDAYCLAILELFNYSLSNTYVWLCPWCLLQNFGEDWRQEIIPQSFLTMPFAFSFSVA